MKILIQWDIYNRDLPWQYRCCCSAADSVDTMADICVE